MPYIPTGSELFKELAFAALADAEDAYGYQEPESNAIYFALRAITYALLAGPQPPARPAATFGEPSGKAP